MDRLITRLKSGKVAHWATAYLAAAWVLYQLLEAFGDPWGLTDEASRVTQVLLIAGLGVCVVLAWYHGEQGRQRISGPELVMIAGIFGLAGVGLAFLPPASSGAGPSFGDVLYATLDLGDVEQDAVGDLVVSPDGGWLATAGVLDGDRALYVRRMGEPRFRMLAGTETARFPTFSPGSDWIAFRNTQDGSIRKVPVEGGDVVTVLPPGRLQNPIFINWSTDGRIIFVDGEQAVYEVADTGGDPVLLLEGFWTHPRKLPGQNAILLEARQEHQVFVLDLADGSIQPVLQDATDAMYVRSGHLLYASPSSNGLFAVPFDLEARRVTGDGRVVHDDVRVVSFGPFGTRNENVHP